MKVEAKAFYGLVSNPVEGFWITLPMDSDEMNRFVDANAIPNLEYGIMDFESEIPLASHHYFNLAELNVDLKLFGVFEERGQLPLLVTAYLFKDQDLEVAMDLLDNGHYEFYEDVTDEDSLGQAVVDSGRLGIFLTCVDGYKHLPEMKQLKKRNLLDLELIKMYLDTNAIGRDRVANGCIIYPKFSTAITETAH
jgi:hypothetical protein